MILCLGLIYGYLATDREVELVIQVRQFVQTVKELLLSGFGDFVNYVLLLGV